MININNIVLEITDGDSYGYFNVPLKIFGQTCFEEDSDEDTGVTIRIEEGVNMESIIEPLNEYINWLADCKNMLEEYYFNMNKDWIDEEYNGKMEEDWYNSLQIFGVDIVYTNKTFGAHISCGDNMNNDHSLSIEIEGHKINEMWFEG